MSTSLAEQLHLIADVSIITKDCTAFLDAVELTTSDRSVAISELMATSAQINELATAMESPEDAEELYRCLSTWWLELRLQWHRHNDVSNYELFRLGAASPIALVRGSISSYIIDRFESILSREQLDKLNESAVAVIELLRDGLTPDASHAAA